MPQPVESKEIKGVYTVELPFFSDERGRFTEAFRKEWFPFRSWDKIQNNRSDSKAGVLRGLHFHHHQADYWYLLSGTIKAGICDIRPGSPTYMKTQVLEIGDNNHIGFFIPPGVIHGFYAVIDATLMYIVDNYYNGTDEFGVAWNDPDVNIPWGISGPVLSGRDQKNPLLKDIPSGSLPQ